MTPSRFVIFLMGDLLRIYSGLGSILCYLGFAEFSVIETSRIYFTDFGVLEFFFNFQNPLFLCILPALIFRACFILKTWLKVAVPVYVFISFSHRSRAFSFFVDPVPFLFLFVWFIPIFRLLAFVVRALVSDVLFPSV